MKMIIKFTRNYQLTQLEISSLNIIDDENNAKVEDNYVPRLMKIEMVTHKVYCFYKSLLFLTSFF